MVTTKTVKVCSFIYDLFWPDSIQYGFVSEQKRQNNKDLSKLFDKRDTTIEVCNTYHDINLF